MRPISFLLAGAALAAALPAVAAPTPAPSVAAPSPSGDVEASRVAVGSLDFDRLVRDRDYAAQMLVHLDRLAAAAEGNAEISGNVDTLRLFALSTLERRDEVRTLLDRQIERRPREAHLYGGPLYAALFLTDYGRAVAVVETASRNVPGVNWGELRRLFDRDTMSPVFAQLHLQHDDAARVRLANALFRIGWPGDGDTESADFLRSILVEDRIAHQDERGAADYAAGITAPSTVLPMIVRTRYDRVLAPGQDRLALLRQSLDQRDRETIEALTGAPQDLRRVLDRAQFLRGLGRDAEAFVLLEPFTRDVPRTVAAGEQGMWLVNEAGYALIALGRNEDAVRLTQKLAALPLASNGALIGPSINHSILLYETGHFAEALAHAQRLDRDAGAIANDFGKMWIASSIVCSLAGLHRNAEAAPQLERLRAQAELNPGALMRAYLCLDDLDAAATLMVHRLESDSPDEAILSLQTYTLAHGDSQRSPLYDRLTALRDRPAVHAALERVGRVMTLPLARTYWGDF